MKFDLSQYEPVEARLERFWNAHPNGRIETRLLTDPAALDEAVFWAGVWFDAAEEHPRGTGHASEMRGTTVKDGANLLAHLENAETSSIGRALANCGWKARKEAPRPSREEMRKSQQPDSPGDRQAAAVEVSNREALIAGIHALFRALHTGEKFYPWASTSIGRPVSQISDLDFDDLSTVNQHLGTEQEALAALNVPAAPEPPAMVRGAE